MATQEKLTFIIEAEDRAKATLQSLEGSFGSLQSKIKDNAGTIAGVTATAGVAFAGISALVMKTTSDFADAEKSATQLQYAVRTVTGATEEQYQATKDLIAELEKKGVLDGDNISRGVAQLSTMGLQNESVRGLTKSLADYAVNQYGVTASGDQLVESANGIAKAFQGNFKVFTNAGIILSEAQKQTLQFGTEQERVSAINEIFAKNLKYTSDVALTTLEGQTARANVQLGNMSESIGQALQPALLAVTQALLPMITKIQEFIQEHPKLTAGIIIVVGALAGLTAVIGTVALAMLALSAVSLPVVAVIAGIALAVAGIIALFIYWKDITNWLGQIFFEVFEAIKSKFMEWWNAITTTVTSIWTSIQGILTSIGEGFKVAWEFIKNVTKIALDFILTYLTPWGLAMKVATLVNMTAIAEGIKEAWGSIKAFFADVWNGIKSVFQGAIDYINRLIDKFMDKVRSMMDAVASVGKTIGGGVKSAVSSISGVFKRASGGSVTPNTPYVVGENGQEVFVPNSYGSILNQGQLGGAGGITINLSGNTFLGDDGVAERIGDQLVKILRLNTKL